MSDPLGWLADAAADRQAAGLHRSLVVRAPDEDVLDLAGNDYLGLSRHPAVLAAAARALQEFGAGATGSRLVTGTTRAHADLEAALAARTGFASALVFSSGYLANLGVVTALSGPGTLVVSDAANHASLVDACRLSRAQVAVVPHLSVDAVGAALAATRWQRALVVTDAVFSVDGDLAPLAALHAVAREAGAVLVVDEAHALGVRGPEGAGACAEAGLAGEPDVVATATLSKSLGSQGGAVLGPPLLRPHLIDTARSFVFDTALAPSAAAAAAAALALVDEARLGLLRQTARALADGVRAAAPAGAVVRVPVGDPARALAAQRACLARGVRVGCFRPPSVPQGQACLRLTARADLSAAQLARAVDAVRAALAETGLEAA